MLGAFWLQAAPVARFSAGVAFAAEPSFTRDIRPLLGKYCYDCHAGDVTEAEVDLGAVADMDDVRRQVDLWLKTRRMLDSEQMPPKDAEQPSDAERVLLRTWVRDFLRREAEAQAGDPGPIVVRRLNNEEYRYTVRDLTGVTTLDPTREFPVDGAAGEGFINAASAQSMSPSLVTKYLDAAKEVASHTVLLPDGLTFSPGTSRREWTDERVEAIRRFYDRFTVPTQVMVAVGGTGQVANQGGAIPLVDYLAATLEEREALASQQKTVAAVAHQRSLNAKYLETLWRTLSAPPGASRSLLLDDLRKRWRAAGPADAPRLAAAIEPWQRQLWKFNTIGQLTAGGKQKVWMEKASPLVAQRDLRLALPQSPNDSEVLVYLAASDLDDGNNQDHVVWKRPRLEFPPDAAGRTHPPILLCDVPALVAGIQHSIQRELPRTDQYLDALASRAAHPEKSLDEVARQRGLNATLLKQWSELVGLGQRAERNIAGHLKEKVTRAHGYEAVNGWGSSLTPSLLTNRSNDDVSFLTLTVPARGVVVHPSPTQESIVAWRSPLDGNLRIRARVADADDKCGNGAAWRVELLSESGAATLARGQIDNGREARFQPPDEFAIRRGDVVSLVVNARDRNHTCDTTHVELTLEEIGGEKRRWDLAGDVVDRVLEANPLPDSHGNADTWHFCAADDRPEQQSTIPPGSALANWRSSVVNSHSAEETTQLARSVRDVLNAESAEGLKDSDRRLRRELTDWKGPLRWTTAAQAASVSATASESASDSDSASASASSDIRPVIHPPLEFGKHPSGPALDEASLCVRAPRVLEVRLPSALAAGAELVVSAELHAETSAEGSAQVQLSLEKPPSLDLSPALPILVGQGAKARDRLETSLADFRDLFPAMLCYSRIVPVDEVVTLTLYFREDEHLRRLMLNEAERAELERLWDELLYVAREPIALTVAFEQIYEFATQDRPDLVKAFGPMREPINARADVFRKRLEATEPAHLDAVLEFADRAWRRPLADSEQTALREFYRRLRGSEIGHEEAIRLTLARVLTSPKFLYRHEQPASGTRAAPVSSAELATRLSYFLWSSLPDAELREAADSRRLVEDEILLAQTRRMLKDPRARRLAIQFACQWLHLRDFDQNDDKNEKLYPEFADLRDDMYEETVRFFEDMFREDRSILELIDADHTFLNESLARHYGVEGVAGGEWRRVEGVRDRGRGGVLGMASRLALQSGASRTSPILRGNWIYETLLGERLPRPPANVPQLPENVPQGLTARQLIEQHSSVPACARCHAKIDPFGFALEQYDAIGRLRPDKMDTRTKLEDGTPLEGLDGLRQYLLTRRRDEVVRQFCRKLLGFALGREVQLSDELLLDKMQADLQARDFRFHAAVETIVTSEQFRRIRGTQYTNTELSPGDNP